MMHGPNGTVSPANVWKNSGVAVTIIAMPASGHNFSNWAGIGSGSYTGTGHAASIMMGGPITETTTLLTEIHANSSHVIPNRN